MRTPAWELGAAGRRGLPLLPLLHCWQQALPQPLAPALPLPSSPPPWASAPPQSALQLQAAPARGDAGPLTAGLAGASSCFCRRRLPLGWRRLCLCWRRLRLCGFCRPLGRLLLLICSCLGGRGGGGRAARLGCGQPRRGLLRSCSCSCSCGAGGLRRPLGRLRQRPHRRGLAGVRRRARARRAI